MGGGPVAGEPEQGAMYIRIVRAQTRPGQVEELARRWQGFIGPRIRATPGFRHAHFGADRAANTTVAVSVWDDRPEEAALEPMVREFRGQVADLAAGAPAIEEYEVLAEA